MENAELAQRDKVLDGLAERRSDLILHAKVIARSIALKNGTVTSVEVLERMREIKFLRIMLSGVDTRFMGVVFRDPVVWSPVSWRTTGSHGRPVRVWSLNAKHAPNIGEGFKDSNPWTPED